ncbi:hypothetical protein MSG28_011337 [Choristoneura fumiferana]|uniref:Uncharacterized protein n=1 Tax=Choristoneura fumiferana TaxID=7141 RepID=A0ACC0JN38_CHOFU|nr:hypothetical protein MSG28_011337 [Choristoneura fumiferana]
MPDYEHFTAALDLAQTELECCGMTDARNFDMSVWQLRRLGPRGAAVPPSCCVQRAPASHLNPAPRNATRCQELAPNPEFRHVPGCLAKLEDWYHQQFIVFMLSLFVVALLKLGILLVTIFSCIRLRKRRRELHTFIMNSNRTNENIYETKMSTMHEEPVMAKYIQPNNFYSPRVRNPRIFHSKPNEMRASMLDPEMLREMDPECAVASFRGYKLNLMIPYYSRINSRSVCIADQLNQKITKTKDHAVVDEDEDVNEERAGRTGKGLAQPRELFPQSSSPSPPSPGPGPSSRSYEEEKVVILKRLADTKKRLNAIPSETRNTYVAKKREKQLERKQSPNRSECRLMPGSPATPPARKLMPWEIIEDDPACNELATTPRQQRLEAECDTPTREQNARQTHTVHAKDTKPGPSKENVIPNIIKKDTKSKHNKKEVITGPDYGTKRAEEIFEGWCQTLQAESDEDEEDDIGDIDDKPTPVDITCEESAILPPNLAEDVRQWLEDEDADADKTITTMLPIDHLTFDWTCDHTSFKGQREIFTATPGPTFDLDDTTTPLDIFRKIFDDHLLDLIVTQTNKHSNLLIDQITTEHSRLIKWENTDREEILIFLSILILQGLAPLNVESDYFKENGYLTLKYFKNLMTYNRFTLLKRMIHFSDNMTDLRGLTCAQKKLRKIQPVLDHLNEKFGKLYIPKQNIAIDESLLKWHGRLSFAQKIATKAAKVGVKSYELCESDTGYLWSFFVYTGKDAKTTDGKDRQDENEQPTVT